MKRFCQLLVQRPGTPDRVFTLATDATTAGRAEINDIVLTDAKVSRVHARFERSAEGYAVVDLGSANGISVNGARVARARLAPGDIVQVGDSTIRLEIPAPPVSTDSAIAHREEGLGGPLDGQSLQTTLTRTDLPRLAVHTPAGTSEVTLDRDAVTIGRDGGADVVLAFPEASRRHARIERRRDQFVLRDLGSTNGSWLAGRRLDEHVLRDGDTVCIGPAQLTFKRGFAPNDLTMIRPVGAAGAPRRTPVVFVPGFMGSELWRGDERLWPNVRYLLSNPEVFRLPDSTPLEPRAVVGEVVLVPGLVKLDRYKRVADYLVEELGYERGKDVLEFAYDWRQDVRDSAKRLAQAIDDWPVTPPVTIVAHSMGCLVSRWYVERLGGAAKVGRLVLVGGPHQGAPRAITGLVGGAKTLLARLVGDRLSEVLATFPSTFQLLPRGAAGVDQTGQPLDLFADDRWLPAAARPLLREASAFRRALGSRSRVPAVSIFGYGLKTITSLNVRRDTAGSWQKVDFGVAATGDDSVPEVSAILPGSEIHPVRQNHGALYVDNDVKMRLKVELMHDESRD
jgi:pSer/pThr/pTyr-binding forkhead associated (FHA) protein